MDSFRRRLQVGAQFVVYLLREYNRDKAFLSAAALTLSTLGALVPLAVVGLSIFATFPPFEGAAQQIQSFVFRNFVPAASETIQFHLSRFVEKAAHVQLIGIPLFVLTSILLIGLVDNALNEIWGVQARRRGAKAFMVYWTLLTLGPILLGLSVGLTSYFTSFLQVPETVKSSGLQEIFFTSVPFALTVAALTTTYVVVPKRRVRFIHAFGSAITAAILFELAKQGFALYVTHIPTYEVVYGALAALPLFLLWLYLSWLIVLLGAEIANCLETFNQRDRYRPISRYVLGLALLYQIWKAHQRGKTCTLEELCRMLPSVPESGIAEVIRDLRRAGLIGQFERGDYILRRDLGQLTLLQLYKLTPWRLPLKEQAEGLDSPQFIREGLRPLLVKTDESLADLLGASIESVFTETLVPQEEPKYPSSQLQ